MHLRIRRSAAALSSAVILAASVHGAFADNSVAYSGGQYTQNFDSLFTTSTPPSDFATSFVLVPIATAVNVPIDLTGPSADGSTIPAISSMSGWYAQNYGGNSAPLNYNVDDGANSNVALTAYYDPAQQTNGNNLALGALTSSSSGNVVFGVKLVNTSNASLNAISLSYTGELFHQDTGSKTLTFGYTIDPTNSASIPVDAGSLYGGLNVANFATGVAGAVAQSAASQEQLSVTNLPLSTTWAPGQALWLTWTMNTAGGGQGLAIDNLAFSASSIAASPTLTWASTSGVWDNSTANWAGTSTIFTNGSNNAVFGNIATNANITVQAAGVSAQSSITINNSGAGVYTFSGGSIGGSAASFIVTSGTVQLKSANSYGLATNLVGGTLIVDNNNELGASTASLNFQGGALALAANVNASTRPLTVTSSGGVINTNGYSISFGGASGITTSIKGVLEVSGGGNVNLGVQPSFGSATSPAGSLQIDAGSSVTILGNSRSSPSDMYAGGVINGQLIIQTSPANGTFIGGGRINLDSVGANGNSKFTGTGQILVEDGSGWQNVGTATVPKWQFDTSGIVITNTSAQFSAEIDVPIVLNPLSVADPVDHPFTPLNVTTANFLSSANPNPTNAFGTVIGGTKIGTQGHGPTFSNMVIKGVISGNSDISLGNDYKSGGSGDVTFAAHNTYTGATLINGGGALYLGVPDALPTTTDVVMGAFSGAGAGSIDLSGNDQHVRSIEVGVGGNTPQLSQINNSGASNATLTITGNDTPFYPFNAELNDGGQASDGSNGTHTLALNKSGTSTLVLGEYQYAGSKTTSTYSGGTTVSGGILQVGFDGAMGASTGSLTLDGGTLSVQDPAFIGDAGGTETTVSMMSARPLTVTANGGTLTTPSFQATLQVGGLVSMVEPVAFSSPAYHWGGALSLTGDVGSTVTINGTGGSVSVSNSPTIQVASTVTLTAGGSSDPFTDSTSGTQHVGIMNNGLFAVTANQIAVAGLTGSGNTTVAAGSTLAAASIHQNTLSIGGTVTITSPSMVNTLSLAGSSNSWTGTLDLQDSLLVVETGTSHASVMATLENQIAFGKTAGLGILSTGLPANEAIAVVDNSVLNKTSFGGLSVDANSILVGAELLGDTNVDGHVDLNDLTMVLSHLGTTTSAWTSGNFDGAPTIDLTDLNDVLNNLGASLPTGAVSGGTAAAPEPASLAILALGGAALVARRRKH